MSSTLWAAEPSEPLEFIGIVQFVKGRPTLSLTNHLSDSQKKEEALKFKSFFHRGDAVTLREGDTLKFITASKCTAVVYGPSTLKAPAKNTKNHIWTVENGNSRWICKNREPQEVALDEHSVTLSYGELIYTDKKILTFEGRLNVDNQTLFPNIIYRLSSGTWVIESNDLVEVSAFDKKTAKPIESFDLEIPNSPSSIKTRWTAGVIVGDAQHMHDQDRYKIREMSTNGEKLSVMFDAYDKQWVGSFSFYREERPGLDSHQQECFPSGGASTIGTSVCPYSSSDFNSIESIIASIGVRWNPHRWWSWTTALGIGQKKFSIEASGPEFEPGPKGHFASDFLALQLSGGLDFYLEMLNWLGLYGGGDLVFSQTLAHMGTRPECGDGSCGSNGFPDGVDAGFSTFGLQLHLGLSLLF